MPVVLTEPIARPVPPNPRRKRLTRAECKLLESAGAFDQDRVELIEGELISKMGKNRPHVDTARIVFLWLVRVFGDQYVNFEAPIDVAPGDNPINEPEPDVIVLKRSYIGFRSAT